MYCALHCCCLAALLSHVFIGCRPELHRSAGLSPITMSSRADSAVPTLLSSIRNELIGKKLRVVGKYVPIRSKKWFRSSLSPRILSHDVRSSSVLLWNDNHIVLADISLCLPTSGSVPWLRETWCTVTLFGYLERSQVMCFTLLARHGPHGRLTPARHVPGRHAFAGPPGAAPP